MATKSAAAATTNSSSQESKASTTAASAPMDPGQLLALCYEIKETLAGLETGTKQIQLRLRTLKYVGDNLDSVVSLKCSNGLIELQTLSQQLVRQLDELRAKLADLSQEPISFQIASQQLAYFTSEWHDSLTPKFNATLRLANEQLDLGLISSGGNGAGQSAAAAALARPLASMSAAELRVREALLRLKQSIEENERLIITIANNLEYTKTAIQAIFESLQVSRPNLEAGQTHVREAIQIQRRSHCLKLACGSICLALAAILLLVALRLVGIL